MTFRKIPPGKYFPIWEIGAEIVVSWALLGILPALMLMFTKGCGLSWHQKECNWEGRSRRRLSYKWIRLKVYKLLWTVTLVYSLMLIWIMKSVTFPKALTIIPVLQKLYLGRCMAVPGRILKQMLGSFLLQMNILVTFHLPTSVLWEGRGSNHSDCWRRNKVIFYNDKD